MRGWKEKCGCRVDATDIIKMCPVCVKLNAERHKQAQADYLVLSRQHDAEKDARAAQAAAATPAASIPASIAALNNGDLTSLM